MDRRADGPHPAVRELRHPRSVVRRSLITGGAILVPLAVTLMVLGFVVNFVAQTLDPVVGVVQSAPVVAPWTDGVLIKGVVVVLLLVTTFAIGFVAEFTSRGTLVGREFDAVMESIPGLGSIYTSFNEMSELLLDSDTDSFQDVRLVEYPTRDSYVVAFVTADTPERIEEATDHEGMVTLFMPMAPNPVMGGFVVHVSSDRVVDVDMTVEEGIRSIVTSGVAVGEDHPAPSLSGDELRDLGRSPTTRLERVTDGDARDGRDAREDG